MNTQIIEEAADWFVEFSMGSADEAARSAFDRWLRKSPEHVRVYLELLPIWEDGGIPLPGGMTTAQDCIALARGSENIVRLGQSSRQPPETLPASAAGMTPSGALTRRFGIAASFLLILLVSYSSGYFGADRSPTYGTDLGQHRSIRLADGSTVQLNTLSRIRVKFTENAREVDLLEGQALFNVAKDPRRPFSVKSDATQVLAVGTVFDVYRKRNDTIVTVVEGRVRVDPVAQPAVPRSPSLPPPSRSSAIPEQKDGQDANTLLLRAGQQLTLSADVHPRPREADLSVATAWTQGRLIFDATPLPEVAEEFNRYSARRIVVEDLTLNDFHVNGSFRSSDPASLIQFLKQQPALAVHESLFEVRITRG